MRITRLTVLLMAVATFNVFAQTPPSSAVGPTFDVVSVKPGTQVIGPGFRSGIITQPDGRFLAENAAASVLIAGAYPPAIPADIVGLPGWATSERYTVSAASSLPRPTSDEKLGMLRAMLADRFKLLVHIENREQQVYNLVVARSDGRLGPNIKPSEADCAARAAAQRAAADAARAAGAPPPRPEIPDFSGPAPQCSFRMTGDRMDGGSTMEILARLLRPAAGRVVVDKTGLSGYYQMSLTYDRMAGLRGPDAAPAADAAPSVFTAVQEQLGLKLESARVSRETLVIDRLARPTEN